MDHKKLVRMTEERMQNLTYVEFMEAMNSLEDCHLFRRELLTAIHEGNHERIGVALQVALYHYHQEDVRLNNDFGDYHD